MNDYISRVKAYLDFRRRTKREPADHYGYAVEEMFKGLGKVRGHGRTLKNRLRQMKAA